MPADQSSNPTSERWFLSEPSQESKSRLFCLPYSGCGASMYRQWPHLIDGIEICPIQLPGRENRIREKPYSTYEGLATDLVEAIFPYFDRPFAFFGHCASALLGYEITVRLLQRGGPVPIRLFVSSQVAPHQGPYGRFLQMNDSELAEELTILIRQMGGTPIPDLIELYVDVLRADVEANKRYAPDHIVNLPCPITAIGWENDKEIEPRLMTGWSDYGKTTFRTFKGGHYEFLNPPNEFFSAISEDLRPTK